MPVYDYQAKDKNGKTIIGAVEAVSETLAMEALADKQLIPIYLQRRAEGGWWQTSLKFFNQVKSKDLVIFLRQLSVMSEAAMPLLESLRILIKQTENNFLQIVISDLADEIEGGVKLSAAMAKYPDIFSDFYINMVKSAEISGRLDEVLNYLADEAEKNHELLSKIRGAMIYPAFIMGGLVVVGFVMMAFVIPKLTVVLQETKATLPLSTKILITVSNFMAQQWWLLLLIALAAWVGLRLVLRRPAGKLIWHHLQLKLPIFGLIYRQIYLVRFTRSLSTLLRGGVPLTRSLQVVAGVVGNVVYQDLIARTIREVEEGNSVSTVFLQSDIMPAMVSQMMVVGEKTGRLEEVLQRLANFYGHQVENLVANLVTLVEPLIMIILGLAVGMMISAIILPLYNMATNL